MKPGIRRVKHHNDGTVTLTTTVGMKGPHHPRRSVILTARRSAEAAGDTVESITLDGYNRGMDDWIVTMRIRPRNANRYRPTVASGT